MTAPLARPRSRHMRSLAIALALCLLPADSAPPWRPSGRVLDAVESEYTEDAPAARPVAAVAARLCARSGQRWLELVVAARGPRVVPVEGLEGVHGINLKTAQELHRLLRDGRLGLAVRDGQGRHVGAGTVGPVASARLPVRRLRPDGDVDLSARTEAAWPVEVSFVSAALPEGHSTFALLVDGVPRLRVEVDGARIAAIQSLGEPPLLLTRRPLHGVGEVAGQ